MGAGMWGTTFAQVLCDAGTPAVLWARRPELAETIAARHENPDYLPGIALTPALTASADPAHALDGASLVVLAVPAFGQVEGDVSGSSGDPGPARRSGDGAACRCGLWHQPGGIGRERGRGGGPAHCSYSSALTCSMIACSRWCFSAWTSSTWESVMKA